MTSEQRIQNTANQHHCHHWACWTHQDQQSSAVSRQSRCNKQWRGNMINPSNCCVVSHYQHDSKHHNITQARPSSTLQAGERSNHLKHNSTTVVAVRADTPTTILVSDAQGSHYNRTRATTTLQGRQCARSEHGHVSVRTRRATTATPDSYHPCASSATMQGVQRRPMRAELIHDQRSTPTVHSPSQSSLSTQQGHHRSAFNNPLEPTHCRRRV
jgi:hypothetical protein